MATNTALNHKSQNIFSNCRMAVGQFSTVHWSCQSTRVTAFRSFSAHWPTLPSIIDLPPFAYTLPIKVNATSLTLVCFFSLLVSFCLPPLFLGLPWILSCNRTIKTSTHQLTPPQIVAIVRCWQLEICFYSISLTKLESFFSQDFHIKSFKWHSIHKKLFTFS